MEKNKDNVSGYEKEIYSDTIPLSKREIVEVINKYCKIENHEPFFQIPSYVISQQGSKLLVFYQTEIRVIEFPEDNPFYYLNHKKPDNLIKRPDYLGYVDVRETKPPIEIPIQIRVVSYHEELDLWWGRLTEEILKKVDKTLPGFVPKTTSNVQLNENKGTEDLIRVPRSSVVRSKWKRVWHHIKGWRDGGISYEEISERLEDDPVYRNQPHDRNTLSLIEKAARAGKLEE